MQRPRKRRRGNEPLKAKTAWPAIGKDCWCKTVLLHQHCRILKKKKRKQKPVLQHHHLIETFISINHLITFARHYVGSFVLSGVPIHVCFLCANSKCALHLRDREFLTGSSKKMATAVKACISVSQRGHCWKSLLSLPWRHFTSNTTCTKEENTFLKPSKTKRTSANLPFSSQVK